MMFYGHGNYIQWGPKVWDNYSHYSPFTLNIWGDPHNILLTMALFQALCSVISIFGDVSGISNEAFIIPETEEIWFLLRSLFTWKEKIQVAMSWIHENSRSANVCQSLKDSTCYRNLTVMMTKPVCTTLAWDQKSLKALLLFHTRSPCNTNTISPLWLFICVWGFTCTVYVLLCWTSQRHHQSFYSAMVGCCDTATHSFRYSKPKKAPGLI